MARIIRIAIDVAEAWASPGDYSVEVTEVIRTAKPRTILAAHVGSEIRDEDIDLTSQVVEDCIRSAIGRTLGIAQTLQF